MKQKRRMIGVGVVVMTLLCLNLFVTPASATYSSYSEVAQAIADNTFNPDLLPSGGKGIPAQAVAETFPSRAAFDAAYPGAPLEDFEATLIQPPNLVADYGPINSSTDNLLFAPGGIMEGISIDTTDIDNDLVVATAGSLPGITSAVIGANTFTDNTVIVFSDANVSAVAMDIFSPLDAQANFDILIYGTGDVLQDTVPFMTDTDGEFFGIKTDAPITRIVISGVGGDEAELIDNLAFGVAQTKVPTLGEWGMIIMFVSLLGVGAIMLRRRQSFAAV